MYKELLSAENMADKASKSVLPRFVERDFDKDGFNEVLLESPDAKSLFQSAPGRLAVRMGSAQPGAQYVERPDRVRPEAYHRQLLDFLHAAGCRNGHAEAEGPGSDDS